MQTFDFNQARNDGVNDSDIVSAVRDSGAYNYKFDQALADGKKPSEIIDYLIATPERFTGLPDTSPVAPMAQEGQQAVNSIDSNSLPGTEDLSQYPTIDIIKSPETIAEERVATQESLLGQEATIALEENQEAPIPSIEATALEGSVLDPAALILENKAIDGFMKVVDKVKWPKHIRTIFDSMTPQGYEELQHTVKFLEKEGIDFTDAMLQGSKGSDLGSFLKSSNLFGSAKAFEGQQKIINNYNKILENIVGKSKGIDISTYKGIKQHEENLVQQITQLRQAHREIEGMYFGRVENIAKGMKEEYRVDRIIPDLRKELTADGVPEEAVNAVNKIFTRLTKPFKDEALEIGKHNKAKAKIMVGLKKNKKELKQAIKDGKDDKAIKLQEKHEMLKESLQNESDAVNALKDTRYMTTTDLLNTRKLLIRKIYKPGGTISSADEDEIRGLKAAVNKIDEFLGANVKSPELQTALGEARKTTVARSKLFGPKDSGGDKKVLVDLLDQGELGKVTQAFTGINAKENVLYIRDVLGKDSTAYKDGLSLYLTNKLGMSPEGLQQILAKGKVAGVEGAVDIKKAAAKITTLDKQDFAMIENAFGKEARLDIKAMQKVVSNMAELEEAASKYGRGITSGKRAYVFSGDESKNVVTRGLKLGKDAVGYYIAKNFERIVSNQPKFRTLTGGITGATVYLANAEQEDISLEGILLSTLTGGIGGYYLGRGTRTAFESDANKVARYLKMGRGAPKNMPKDIEDAFRRIGEAQGSTPVPTLRQGLENEQLPR